MKSIVLSVMVLGAGCAAMLAGASPGPRSTAPRVVVIAELFTSEGCSSCPPADALVTRLVTEQPVAGVDIVALGSHVDYWDRLGWRDPYSTAFLTQRQSQYAARLLRTDTVYTPQLVVDGYLESVGSDEAAARRHILVAAREPKARVDVSADRQGDAILRAVIRVEVPAGVRRTGPADVVVALTEDALVSHVGRGENGGRTLVHSAVVRIMKVVGYIGSGETTASAAVLLTCEQAWKRQHLRVVAFVQEQASRRIVGAAWVKP